MMFDFKPAVNRQPGYRRGDSSSSDMGTRHADARRNKAGRGGAMRGEATHLEYKHILIHT